MDKLHVCIRTLTCPFEKIEPYVPPQGKILDYGCGHGVFSFWMYDMSRQREIIGYDICSIKIRHARCILANRNNIRLFDSVAYTSYAPFDAIVVLDVLYLIKEKEEVISHLGALLKQDGFLIIKEVVKEKSSKYIWAMVQELIAKKVLSITKGEGLFFITADELIHLLQTQNFDVTSIDLSRGYWYPHRLFIGKKKA